MALLAGELLRRLPALRRRDPHALAAIGTPAVAVALGSIAVAVANRLTTGTIWFGYEHPGFHAFWPSSRHQRAIPSAQRVVIPPLLVLGQFPSSAAARSGRSGNRGFRWDDVLLFSSTPDQLDQRVLAPRSAVPVVVFLLIGYADLLARLSRRLTVRPLAVRAPLIAVVSAAALLIGVLPLRQQRPGGQALAAAERIARERGIGELGVIYEAEKVGVLFSGAFAAWNAPMRPPRSCCAAASPPHTGRPP